MDETPALFIKGFNDAYLLEQYEPALLEAVLRHLNLTTDYLLGLSEGQKEYQLNRIRTELQLLSDIRASEHDKHRNR